MTETKKPRVGGTGLIEGKAQKSTTKTSLEPTTFAEVAPQLARNGYLTLPIKPRSKAPDVKSGWQNLRLTEAEIFLRIDVEGQGGCGVGVLTGVGEFPVAGIDADITHRKLNRLFRKWFTKWAVKRFGRESVIPERVGQAPKFLLVVRAAEPGWPKRVSAAFGKNRMEFLGAGQQFVAYGIHESTGRPYTWHDVGGGLAFLPAAELPVVEQTDLDEIIEKFEQLAEELGLERTKARSEPSTAPAKSDAAPVQTNQTAAIGRAIGVLQNAEPAVEGNRDNSVYAVAAQMHDLGVERLAAIPLVDQLYNQWCQPPKSYKDVLRIVNSVYRNSRGSFGNAAPEADFTAVTVGEAVTPKRRLQVLPASKFEIEFQRALRETWTVQGVLLEKVPVVAMYGTPKSGKTFLALDLGLSVASGVDWHGRRVKQQRVLYLAGEGGRGLIRRAKAWSVARGVSLDELNNFHMIPRAVALDDPAQLRELIEAIEELTRDAAPLGLLIADTVSRCMAGDENATVDMSRFVRACDELHRVTGATIMLVHHAGKDQSRGMRGSNVLLAGVDLELRVKREGDVTVLEATAARDQELFGPLRFELRWTDTGHMTDDLENIGAPVPRLLDGPAEKPLSDREQTALDLLTWEAGSSGGSIAISTWRNSVVEALFKDTSKASTRVLFKRIRDELERRKLVIVDGEMVRLPGRVSARKVTTAGIARAILGSELTH